MSERKVLNKYFPPDFDPSKIKRRKGLKKDPQIQVRLMAPFSMRCERCGEYVYKGKKFNARKETAEGEQYYGVKIFRFYIKCPTCSSEITFKTDPKNADYVVEHGAKRNFENWSDANDPGNRLAALPTAAEDDEYDSEGNLREDTDGRDAMADLERSQEASRREMEVMDELADLRQRNARLELSNVSDDPTAMLASLHAARQSAEEEARLRAEQEEDDALVAKYFAKIPSGPGPSTLNGKAIKSKLPLSVNQDGDEIEGDNDQSDEDTALPAALTIKRRPVSGPGEPSVQSILASRGKVIDSEGPDGVGRQGMAAGASSGSGSTAAAVAQLKRKREGMQKLLGIKKKTKP